MQSDADWNLTGGELRSMIASGELTQAQKDALHAARAYFVVWPEPVTPDPGTIFR